MRGPSGVLVHFLSKQDLEAEAEENSWVEVIGLLCCQRRKRKRLLLNLVLGRQARSHIGCINIFMQEGP